jgi:protein TilB
MINLARVTSIEQLYLTGNPCSNWQKYRELVAAMVTQLKELDGKEITHSERLAALQVLDSIKEELRRDAELNVKSKAEKSTEDDQGYTKESRVRMAREAEAQKLEKEQESSKRENEYYGI